MVLVLPRRRQCAAHDGAGVPETHAGSAPSIARWPGSASGSTVRTASAHIFPAMANSVMMYAALGYPEDHPQRAIARKSVEKLLVVHDEEAYCQPCVSPIWDTGLACHALLEAGGEHVAAQVKRGLDWLVPMQVLDVRGDWMARRPELRPGGWAFQYANPHYPDVDDTAVVAMAMDRLQGIRRRRAIPSRASLRWRITAPRSRARANGSSACRARTAPGARSMPTTNIIISTIFRSPITARCSIRRPRTSARAACRCWRNSATRRSPVVTRAIDYLRKTQLADGSWYGRWGMNYIYGTWSVLCALNAAGFARDAPEMRKAADWLAAIQNADGGWGEDGASYKLDYKGYEKAPSTASQTAWALLGLMAAGEVDHPAVARGIKYLAENQRRRRLLERDALHRDRFSARVLSALPRLCEILPAVGAGALPQSQKRQCPRGGVGDVRRGQPIVDN